MATGYIVMDRRKGAVTAEAQTIGEGFSSGLSRRILLAAAEAVCHNMGEREFAALCAECYHDAKQEPNSKNGGIST